MEDEYFLQLSAESVDEEHFLACEVLQAFAREIHSRQQLFDKLYIHCDFACYNILNEFN